MIKYYILFGVVIYLYYLCNSKREQENMEHKIVINRTTLNGTKWEIVVDNYGAATTSVPWKRRMLTSTQSTKE